MTLGTSDADTRFLNNHPRRCATDVREASSQDTTFWRESKKALLIVSHRLILYITLLLLAAGCAKTPLALTQDLYQEDDSTEVKELLNDDFNAVIIVQRVDENCSDTELFHYVKIPAKQEWRLTNREGRHDCDLQRDAQIKIDFEKWRQGGL